MSHTRHFNLRCAVCYEKDSFSATVRAGRDGVRRRTWESVRAVGRQGRGVICKCLTCGHQYVSTAKAARREIDYIERQAKAAEKK